MKALSLSMIKLKKALELYFVRNGETVGNLNFQLQGQTEGFLSEKGKQQAQLLGKELIKISPFQKIYVSPLKRATDTYKHTGLIFPSETTTLLSERKFGTLTNMTYFDMIHLAPNEKPQGNGESLEDLRERAMLFLQTVIENNPKECRILAFAHHEIILSCIMAAVGIPLEKTRNMMISNASISQLDYYNGRWVAKRINELGHLGELKQTERSY